ncbi:hypothetical protein A2880_04665 [Candidatus Peribacteria bacterium RIFCSPHIGHO2_01_FULL_49_38]|nr:MAG: hypothetical protein A2880_04665 [Candidatus Peribacteria bacterium RIFCSPHIGHO2_01_FULL_49_38]
MKSEQKQERQWRKWLKLIGVLIFVWILSRIDFREIFLHIRSAKISSLFIAYMLIFAMYGAKTLRWHTLANNAGGTMKLQDSWRIFNIGVFLGNITPGKIGEFGRAAYLKKHGVSLPRALAIALIDRLADVIVIGFLALFGMWHLFGTQWSFVLGGMAMTMIITGFLARKTGMGIQLKTISIIMFWTLCSWLIYFIWTLLLARSIGIDLRAITLVSALTITGIVSLLPIAPAGLGTRDAALLTLLTPFGIQAEQTVALAFMMFIGILFSSMLGGWYWFRHSDHCSTHQ